MAVNVLSPPTTTKTTTTPTKMNKRFPPLADRTSLSYKLTNLSKQKLAREATAPDPDIRRCLHHFRMHILSVEWAQQETASKITSFEFEDDSESEDEESTQNKTAQIQRKLESIAPTPALTATESVEIEVETQTESPSPKEEEQTIHVHFEVVPQPQHQQPVQTALTVSEEKEKDDGLMDKGQRCLEKAWPSPVQCMPVRIAG
ncbi:hypothetical protein BDW74DRAFT_152240 [Aspergillus multicolor]|uniref:uncharacterized protein n=1 Tax=Aspergillus multicolor TaxID=41759 RepID=UPI003CCDE333